MTNTENETLSARFSASAGLGYGWVIFRTRPLPTIRLGLVQAAIYAGLSLWMLIAMGRAGQDMMAAGEDPAALTAALGGMFVGLAPVYLAMMAGAVLLEAAWLRLFLDGRARVRLGDVGWTFLSFALIFAVFMGGYIVTALIAGIGIGVAAAAGSVLAAVLAGLASLVGFFVFCALVMTGFTALPALAVQRGAFPLGRAFGLARARRGAVLLAWLGFALIYVVVLGASAALMFALPSGYGEAMAAQFANPENPFAQYEVYAWLAQSPGLMALHGAALFVQSVLVAGVGMVSRGIGVRLVLDAEDAAG